MLLTKTNVKKSNASFDAVRASPASYDCVFTARYRVALSKKYGWGIHFDSEGKAALYSKDSSDYVSFENQQSVEVKLIKAMRSKRA